jgi:hypothetical protein
VDDVWGVKDINNNLRVGGSREHDSGAWPSGSSTSDSSRSTSSTGARQSGAKS